VVTGVVIRGDGRGRGFGFPTANIALGGLGPIEYGVYAGRALGHPAAVSVGVRPTFGEGLMPLLEAHLLDFDGDLYGRQIDVELLKYLRPEIAFDDTEALLEQIAADVVKVRRAVGGAGAR
jgi:riboflavin kinase/FMN adenylyltransferase